MPEIVVKAAVRGQVEELVNDLVDVADEGRPLVLVQAMFLSIEGIVQGGLVRILVRKGIEAADDL